MCYLSLSPRTKLKLLIKILLQELSFYNFKKLCVCAVHAPTYFSFLQGYKNEEVLFLSPYLDFCKTRVIKSRKNGGELGSKTSVHVNGVKKSNSDPHFAKRGKIVLSQTFLQIMHKEQTICILPKCIISLSLFAKFNIAAFTAFFPYKHALKLAFVVTVSSG